jgi:hypothetical protein
MMRLAAAIGLGALVVSAQAFGTAFPSPRLYPSFNQSKAAATITTFRVARSGYTAPAGINSKGAITGTYTDDHGAYRGFVRQADGTVAVFIAPGASKSGLTGTFPTSINDNGVVAGYYNDNNSHKERGFVRSANGAITAFDIPGDGGPAGGASVYAINKSGAVLGAYQEPGGASFGFVWANGILKKFGVGSEQRTIPRSLNAAGAIVGSFYSPVDQNTPGFIRNADRTVTKFHIGSIETDPESINSAGTVAGRYFDTKDNKHGFLRAADGTITKLDIPGAKATDPCCISDSGMIAGGYSLDTGNGRGFVRTP